MDHQEKHHQKKEHEHEEQKKEHKAYEQKHEKDTWQFPFHPLWLVVVGIIMTGAAVLVWTFGFWPFR